MCMVHVNIRQETSMTRTSTFAIATLAALAVASLASTGASAHFAGGGGHSAASFAGSPSSAGHISPTGGFAHGPTTASGFARSSVVPRLGGSSQNRPQNPGQTLISQFPRNPVTIPTPNHNHPRPGSRWGAGAVGEADFSDSCLIKQYLP